MSLPPPPWKTPSVSERRRVVITGAGIVTPMGFGWPTNAEGFRSGQSALSEITLFDVSRQRTEQGGQVNLPASQDTRFLPPRHRRFRRRIG